VAVAVTAAVVAVTAVVVTAGEDSPYTALRDAGSRLRRVEVAGTMRGI
jgi:hypothetical protein